MAKSKRFWVFALIIWMAVIFFFTQLPYFTGESTSKALFKLFAVQHDTTHSANGGSVLIKVVNIILRKASHLTAFGIIAILLFQVFRNFRYPYFLSWFLTFLYAITDEWHQSFVPGRTASFQDVLIDCLGAFIALLIAHSYTSRKRKTLQKR
ncbi:VanZ family protein [Neobacillus novalis]|uniref:VanZ family protein n=1 Tax=Neobacillus novalis TaxID=220687 RepID=A0AA95MQW8_9BACI|nr:VanZ family protein [Neobacillus novalis]WHY85581.1 VanZ family protein [Neobacillus novalis]